MRALKRAGLELYSTEWNLWSFQFHLQTEVNRYENKKAYFLQRIFPNQEQLNCCISVAGTIPTENLDGVDTSFDQKK